LLISLAFACALAQTPPIMKLSEIRAGMHATGRTVFAGGKVEEFPCEILGVLENAGPKQSIILARLGGPAIERAGVLQGMSGSPVYYQGRLMGAVALSFPFSKEPIAGIRPIEEMLLNDPAPARRAAWHDPRQPAAALPVRQELPVGNSKLAEISTPFWLSGFTRAAVDAFAPALRAAGLEPVQGISGGGKATTGTTTRLEPGAMISVQLVRGDMSVGADGTVTYIDGNRIFAFGHRFLASGATEIPFSRAEVMTLLPSLNSSFKISTPREWLGTITEDRSTAIAGLLGRQAQMLPLKITVRGRGSIKRDWTYQMELVRDRLFTPLLLQMAVYSALDATERSSGLGSIAMAGRMRMEGAPDVPFSNLFVAEMGAPQQAAAAVAAPVSAVMQSGFDSLKVRALELQLDVFDEKKQLQLDSAWASRREARPGETVEITAVYTGDHGAEVTRTARYLVPLGAPTGPLYFTITDGPTANLAEFRQFLLAPPRSAEQLSEFLLGLHPNDRAYVRVWRAQPTLQVQGENLPAPPPSMAAVLTRTASLQPNSLVTELRMAPADALFAGSRTVLVEVKE
jgi:hypothetical protein